MIAVGRTLDLELLHGDVEVQILDGPYGVDGRPTPDAERYYTALCAKLPDYRAYAASELLALYNDNWLDDEIGPLDAASFAARLQNPSVLLFDEPGNAEIYFDDGGIFAGHAIAIQLVGENPVSADIFG